MEQISIHDVQVREFRREDLTDMRKYFFESSPEFLNRIGLKTPRPGEGEVFLTKWEERLDDREKGGPPIAVMTVLYLGERVGFHPSTHHDPGRSLIMHAHFFREDLKGKGIGSFLRARNRKVPDRLRIALRLQPN
jgi:hypothetical protein